MTQNAAPPEPTSSTRYERILDAALDLFARKGYHGTVVDDVAAEAETSKGGVYFHFPNKERLFLALLDRMAALLRARVEAAISGESDPVAKADIALQVVLQTFASHRSLSRLFFVESLGAGRAFNQRMAEIRASFADLIQGHLAEAVRQGAIPPVDAAVAGRVWFGALNEVVTAWVLADGASNLEEAYPTVRALLLRSIGAQLPAAAWTQASAESQPAPTLPPASDGLPEALLERLRALLERGRQRAQRLGHPVVVSAVVSAPAVDPLAFFERGEAVSETRSFWARPRAGFALAGIGAANTVECLEPRERAGRVRAEWQALLRAAVVEAPGDTIGVG